MRLYLIKRRSDGQFFVNINGYSMLVNPGRLKWAQQWSDKGRFMRTPDGVAGNLRKLCSEPYWNTNPPKGVCKAVTKGWKEVAWHKFEGRRLKAYEIVTMDVDILSMKATPATEFIQIDAIRSKPLNKFERTPA